MSVANPSNQVGINRRTCLKGALCSVPALLWTTAFGTGNSEARPVNLFDTPSQNLLVGYVPREIIDAGPNKLNELLRLPEVSKSGDRSITMSQESVAAKSPETARPIKLSELTQAGKFEKGKIIDAERIDIGSQDWLVNGILVQFLGVFTAAWQWSNGDQGSFTMNLKFKEVPDSCPKLSKAAMGSDFKAIKNGMIPAFGNFVLINGIKVETANPLEMSFGFVDVADETDKSLVQRMFEVVKKLPSVGGVLEGVAAPYITAGTAILELLGQNLLAGPTSNKLIWSDAVKLSFRPGTGSIGPRLKQGYYIIAGNRRNGSNPDWSQYQLRAADPNNSGLRRFLYENPTGSDKIIPVDFSYVIAYIDQKEA